MGKRGRPPGTIVKQDRSTVRATRLTVLVTPGEMTAIQLSAQEAGRTVASFVRALLGLPEET